MVPKIKCWEVIRCTALVLTSSNLFNQHWYSSLPLSWLFDSEALSSVSVESSISELNKALGEGRRVGVEGGSCFGGNSGLFSFPSLAGWNSW